MFLVLQTSNNDNQNNNVSIGDSNHPLIIAQEIEFKTGINADNVSQKNLNKPEINLFCKNIKNQSLICDLYFCKFYKIYYFKII